MPLLLLTFAIHLTGADAKTEKQVPKGDWPSYAGPAGSTKYSPLDQISAQNVKSLRIAWRWESPDQAILKRYPRIATWRFEGTPVAVNGVLYISTSLSQVAAIDGATGRTLWVYDPQSYLHATPPNFGFTHRGVAYWTDGQDARIFIGTGDAYLIALDARSGKPAAGFGVNGRVDLTASLRRPVDRSVYGVSSPPMICRDTVIVGSSIQDPPAFKVMPPGDVRGFDPRTGALRWTFRTIPQESEYGTQTWRNGSWNDAGGANVWAPMSADESLGYVYLPVSAPSADRYGARRPGDNLYSDSLVCLDAATGKRIWHFQLVHHDIWDYDPPAAPLLYDLRTGDRIFRGVAQVSKQGFVYAFDRASGAPVWPIEEKPVPISILPGESSARTQPVPSRPKAFDRQGISAADLLDFTPEFRQKAEALLRRYDYGPLFSPPSERGVVMLPGLRGGASWAGAAYDPGTGFMYVPSVTNPFVVVMTRQGFFARYPEDYRPYECVLEIDGLPPTRPPYGRVTAIDLHGGDHRWMQPLGRGPVNHDALRLLGAGRKGWPYRGFPLATKTLLFVAQEGPSRRHAVCPNWAVIDNSITAGEPGIQVFAKDTGALLAEIPLPAHPTASPMTYMAGKMQFIVVALGGESAPAELVALSR